MKLMKLIGDGEQASLIHLSDEQLIECHQNMIRVLAFRAEVVSCVVCNACCVLCCVVCYACLCSFPSVPKLLSK